MDDLKKKIHEKIMTLSNMSEPFIDLEGYRYAMYRGVKTVEKEGGIKVYNATNEDFVEIQETDSLKIIYMFLDDNSFSIKKHIQERWRLLEDELRSKRKIIARLKQEQPRDNKPNLFDI